MLKLLLIAACVSAVLARTLIDQPVKDYLEHISSATKYNSSLIPFVTSSPTQLMSNPFAQKLFSFKNKWLPGIDARTLGVSEKDENGDQKVSTFSRLGAQLLGIKVFGDFMTDDKENKKSFGVGGEVLDLLKLYYTKDIGKTGDAFFWDAGF